MAFEFGGYVSDPETRHERMTAAPAPDDIARRAYEIYLSRGGENGCDVDDWLQAEAELCHAARPPLPGTAEAAEAADAA